eukprot:COSAG02_NODE_34405_length_484_cov_1.459740_1_plen_54_part_00
MHATAPRKQEAGSKNYTLEVLFMVSTQAGRSMQEAGTKVGRLSEGLENVLDFT